MMSEEELTEDQSLSLQKEILALAERRVKDLGLRKPGWQLNVGVTLDWVPVPPVTVQVRLLSDGGKKNRMSIDRPLTDVEWDRLSRLPFSNGLRKVLNFFKNSENTGTKGTDLISEGVFTDAGHPMNYFNSFLKSHGANFAIRKVQKEGQKERGTWENFSYRIFPVE